MVVSVISNARHKQLLGQIRPSTLNVFAVYTAPAHIKSATITLITICNTGAGTPTFDILHDDTGGLTLDPTPPLAADAAKAVLGFGRGLTANQTISEKTSSTDDSGISVQPGGQIGVRASIIDTVAFTVYGYEELPA